MKHSIIITVIASLMLCLSLPADAQRHRHHPGATTTTTKVDNKATQKADSANAIEAFSDTTSTVADVDTTSTNATYTYDMDDDDWEESVRNIPFKLLTQIFSFGIWGIVIFFLILAIVIVIMLLPLILLALIVRWFIKRHNDDVARKANAQPFINNMTANPAANPTDNTAEDYNAQSTDGTTNNSTAIPHSQPTAAPAPKVPAPIDYWANGVKKISIGIGLVIMGKLIEASALVGIGFLVACYGIGQIVISRKQSKNNNTNNDEN